MTVLFGGHCVNGSPETCGSMTSGGTESILLAMKTYTVMRRVSVAFSIRRCKRLIFQTGDSGSRQSEHLVNSKGCSRCATCIRSVAPITAHAAFDKAAHYFDIKLVLFLSPHDLFNGSLARMTLVAI